MPAKVITGVFPKYRLLAYVSGRHIEEKGNGTVQQRKPFPQHDATPANAYGLTGAA